MAFSDMELKRYENIAREFIEKHRPEPHIREQLDLGFRIKEQSVEVFEIRKLWRGKGKKIESPVAKTTYLKSQKVWKIYWQRADLKWHRYDPMPEVSSLEEFFDVLEKDDDAAFWG